MKKSSLIGFVISMVVLSGLMLFASTATVSTMLGTLIGIGLLGAALSIYNFWKAR